jgi:hypothetical protein
VGILCEAMNHFTALEGTGHPATMYGMIPAWPTGRWTGLMADDKNNDASRGSVTSTAAVGPSLTPGGGRPSPQRGSSRFFEVLSRAVERHVGVQLTPRQPGALIGRDAEQHVERCRELFRKLDRDAIGLGRLFDHRCGLAHPCT